MSSVPTLRISTRPIRWNNQKYVPIRDIQLGLERFRADLMARNDHNGVNAIATVINVLNQIDKMEATDVQGSWEGLRELARPVPLRSWWGS